MVIVKLCGGSSVIDVASIFIINIYSIIILLAGSIRRIQKALRILIEKDYKLR